MTWWDHDTGSIWSQPRGVAIAGPRKGATIELLPSEFTTWGAWVDEHPNTLALAAPGGRSGFDLDEFLIVVDFTTEAKGYPVPEMRLEGVINDTVAGAEIAVVSDPTNPERWTVFSRVIGDTVVELEVDGQVLRDKVTGTTFDPNRGFALEGPLAGEMLALLPGLTSFPGDFDTFWPAGTIWEP